MKRKRNDAVHCTQMTHMLTQMLNLAGSLSRFSLRLPTTVHAPPLSNELRVWVATRTEEPFNGQFVVSKDSKHEPVKLPGFVATSGDELIGLRMKSFQLLSMLSFKLSHSMNTQSACTKTTAERLHRSVRYRIQSQVNFLPNLAFLPRQRVSDLDLTLFVMGYVQKST